ncbi:DUF177 domain-containing protein [Qipengyuania sp. JC766]|uniref:YceD family protein n=1 Tax=Qipengyuania sp. JC766 TaxID=3232139 RepID=UPI00345B1345
MSTPEFSRPVRARALPAKPVELTADEAERRALAARFAIVAVTSLDANVALSREGDGVLAEGELRAELVQSCAVSGDDFPVSIDETFALRFVPPQPQPEEEGAEIEITSEDCDEIEFEGDSFDLGEAVAQTLGLAIDPYAEGPGADTARKDAGLKDEDSPSGPLAEALAGLKKD